MFLGSLDFVCVVCSSLLVVVMSSGSSGLCSEIGDCGVVCNRCDTEGECGDECKRIYINGSSIWSSVFMWKFGNVRVVILFFVWML